MSHGLYRFRECFSKPDRALGLFKTIPFLNGGLFECLDRDFGAEVSPRYRRVDGFSRRADSQPTVPDFLFFSRDDIVDLSDDYGDAKFKRTNVRGLFRTFEDYKFTVAENTPIEEEVALDPELSGRVFENLLAAYNPETQATARQETGSFFTPRPIVDYMADEALIACLAARLSEAVPRAKDIEGRLRHLFSYTTEPHKFSPSESAALIAAIDVLKVLDPAVGSGAFPMGILHKLVHVLGKLDPKNEAWKEKQVVKASEIPDSMLREKAIADIEQAFERNELDYGRKLYLIENCIYGVDIQPIAVQIAKMRFFISLVVEQKLDEAAPNRGIRALPNLETKFVAANTLIGIERPAQLPIRNSDVVRLETELAGVRRQHFTARALKTKRKLREQDAKLRREVAELLRHDGLPDKTARILAGWDPYDQNSSAGFFDVEWMFGLSRGFDVAIGNPPYVSALEFTKTYGRAMRDALNSRFTSATGAYDLYVPFVEQGLRLCASDGWLCYITPNKYLAAKYAEGLRRWILDNGCLHKVADLSCVPVFDETSVYPVISLISRRRGTSDSVEVLLPTSRQLQDFTLDAYRKLEVPYDWLDELPESIWGFLLSPNVQMLRSFTRNTVTLADLGSVNATSTAAESDDYGSHLTSRQTSDGIKVVNTGTIERYVTLWGRTEMTHSGRGLLTPYLPLRKAHVSETRTTLYRSPKLLFAKMARECEAALDDKGEYASLNTNCFHDPKPGVDLLYVAGLCNTRVFMFVYDLLFGALRMSGGYYQFQSPQLRVMPVPSVKPREQERVSSSVRRIMTSKRKNLNADTSKLEDELESVVCQLYGLTKDEIAIVEGRTR